MFRNLTLFRFPVSLASRLTNLADLLPEHTLRPCGPLETHTEGFVSPYGEESTALVAQQGAYVMLALGAEDKLLPSAIVNHHIAGKITALERERGRPVGARERRQLKDDALNELLPRALVKPSRTRGYLDTANGWVVVDSSSRRAAEAFVSAIRRALGSFSAVALAPESSPRATLTEWMSSQTCPTGFLLGDDADMRDPADKGGVARFRRHDLSADEVREHLTTGKLVTQLALTFDERVSFTLDDTLCVRKFKVLDVALESLDKGDRASANAELDARFALMTGEVARLLAALDREFTIPSPSFD